MHDLRKAKLPASEQARPSIKQFIGLYKVSFAVAVFLFAGLAYIIVVRQSEQSIKLSVDAKLQNRTLGFGKIYMLSSPKAVARQDEVQLISTVAGIQIKVVEMHDGKLLNKYYMRPVLSSIPPNDVEKGRWRSHLDTWWSFLDDEIETALFLEDDVDFGLDLRVSLANLRKPLLEMARLHTGVSRMNQARVLPGDWQLLWLGACEEKVWELLKDAQDHWSGISYAETKGPEHYKVHSNFQNILDAYPLGKKPSYSGYARVLQKTNFARCSTAYALTRQGAIDLLYSLTRDPKSTIDEEMSTKARLGLVQSYTVVPPLMAAWKIQGSSIDESLIESQSKQEPLNPSIGSSDNIAAQQSIRRNLRVLIESL